MLCKCNGAFGCFDEKKPADAFSCSFLIHSWRWRSDKMLNVFQPSLILFTFQSIFFLKWFISSIPSIMQSHIFGHISFFFFSFKINCNPIELREISQSNEDFSKNIREWKKKNYSEGSQTVYLNAENERKRVILLTTDVNFSKWHKIWNVDKCTLFMQIG